MTNHILNLHLQSVKPSPFSASRHGSDLPPSREQLQARRKNWASTHETTLSPPSGSFVLWRQLFSALVKLVFLSCEIGCSEHSLQWKFARGSVYWNRFTLNKMYFQRFVWLKLAWMVFASSAAALGACGWDWSTNWRCFQPTVWWRNKFWTLKWHFSSTTLTIFTGFTQLCTASL